jgi:hypothetical protein
MRYSKKIQGYGLTQLDGQNDARLRYPMAHHVEMQGLASREMRLACEKMKPI